MAALEGGGESNATATSSMDTSLRNENPKLTSSINTLATDNSTEKQVIAPPNGNGTSIFDQILTSLEDMKIRIEGLERTVSYTKTSIEFVEFLVFHSNERCQYHDFYDLKMKEAANRSVSYVQTNSKAPESSDNDDNGPPVQRKLRFKKNTTLEEQTNVFMDVSDGDDDVVMLGQGYSTPSTQRTPGLLRTRTTPANAATTWLKGKSKINPKLPPKATPPATVTNFRVPSSMGPFLYSHISKNEGSGRKILSPPACSQRPSKVVKREGFVQPSRVKQPRQKLTPKAQHNLQKASRRSTTKECIPGLNATTKGMRCNFKATGDMIVTRAQVEMSAYVFSPDLDPKEVILKIGDTSATREELNCLSPGQTIDDKIFKLMALKCTSNQRKITLKTTWCLPPSFVDDVCQGQSLEDIFDHYVEQYMIPTPELDYIYVPIKEDTHWYLMVVCLRQKMIYHLDSFIPPDRLELRSDLIKNLSEVLAQLLCSEYYADVGIATQLDGTGWEVVIPHGVPNQGCSDDSPLWVLAWLDMEHAFNPNVLPEISEDKVILRAATTLILGECNELKKTIEMHMTAYWKSVYE